jgi:hypothetical protein
MRMTYPGLDDPAAEFEALRPLAERLRQLQTRCRPFGRDYHALAIALDALDSAAYHFTRQPRFFAGGGEQR